MQTKEYVNWMLEAAYTPEGMERWWVRPRKELDGKTPEEAWDTDREKVVWMAERLL
jgi:hypothetical protein